MPASSSAHSSVASMKSSSGTSSENYFDVLSEAPTESSKSLEGQAATTTTSSSRILNSPHTETTRTSDEWKVVISRKTKEGDKSLKQKDDQDGLKHHSHSHSHARIANRAQETKESLKRTRKEWWWWQESCAHLLDIKQV